MGIEYRVANVIVREHAYRPITGDVYLLGRQTMYFPPEMALGMLKEAGLPAPAIDFHPESRTRLAKSEYISDDDFFRLLGVPAIKAIDVSDYEGADIVHDLTVPIPDRLEGVADFILDGSTLDNVFDPATVLRNVARLLKPGGRLVGVNVASNTHCPYIIPTAHLLLEYFIVNGFTDAKVYMFVYNKDGGMNAFTPDLTHMRRGQPQPPNFTSDHAMALVVMAEKAQHSTWNKSPIQHQYRSEWSEFERNLAVIETNPRPHLARSTCDLFVDPCGFRWIDQTGQARSSRLDRPAATDLAAAAGRQLAVELGRRITRRVSKRAAGYFFS